MNKKKIIVTIIVVLLLVLLIHVIRNVIIINSLKNKFSKLNFTKYTMTVLNEDEDLISEVKIDYNNGDFTDERYSTNKKTREKKTEAIVTKKGSEMVIKFEDGAKKSSNAKDEKPIYSLENMFALDITDEDNFFSKCKTYLSLIKKGEYKEKKVYIFYQGQARIYADAETGICSEIIFDKDSAVHHMTISYSFDD